MNTTHFKVILRTDTTKKDGTSSLCLYANINGVRKNYSLHKSILSKYWNEPKQEVSATCPDWNIINSTIQDYLNKAKEFALYANIERRTIKLTELDDLLRGIQYDRNNIIAFIANDIAQFGSKFAPGTIAVYATQANKLKGFRENISFQELTPLVWRQYENYLVNLGNNQNTVFKAFRTLRVFINRAIEQGIIKENPLKSVKCKGIDGQMQFLTMNELETLEMIYQGFMTPDLKRVLQYFLFACYTGLRYSDTRDLKFANIFERSYIEMKIFKTSIIERIPLSDRAKLLLPATKSLPALPVFRVYCNQVTNRHLKSIMKYAGINKKISFHCARHSFATITLGLSNDIAAVQKLLGHTKIETTQIYARVLDNQKQAAIDKWNAVS